MTDQSPPEKSPAESLRIPPGEEACVIRYIDSQRISSLPLPSNLYQRRANCQPSLRLDTLGLDRATSPFALLTDSTTRFQLPKILPSDFGPREGTQAGNEPFDEEVDSDNCSSTAGDSSVLLSDLLDHLEEAAARSPGPTPNSTFSPSSGISICYSAGEETLAETDTDSSYRVTGPVVTPEESPPLELNTPGCTLSQEYKELVEDFPLSVTGETVTSGKKSIDTQSVASFVFDAGIDANPPVTPKNKQRKHSSPGPVLSPVFFGPFPTPSAHRPFIASSPSGSLRSPSSSSTSRDPSSLSQRPKLSLRKRAAIRSRLHLSDLFKRQEATKP